MNMYDKKPGTRKWLEECLHMFIMTEYIITQPSNLSAYSRVGMRHEAKENYFEALEAYIDARVEEKLREKHEKVA